MNNDDSPPSGASLESLLGDIPLEISVELGRAQLSLRELAEHLGPGSVIELKKLTGEHLDIRINDRLVARGEAVAVGERYAIRVVEIVGGENKGS
jgi:flagellar motor switch protein FliN